MNENINLCEILKDCPKGTKLYSPLFGEVEFYKIVEAECLIVVFVYSYYYDNDNEYNHVEVRSKDFTSDGKYYYKEEYKNNECLLFPSKDQRDWSKFKAPWLNKPKFDPKTLKAFDRVLIRNYTRNKWACNYFSHIKNETDEFKFTAIDCDYRFCIPYNDDTKHLVGTTDEAPEYYRYWED